jgi:hypothetical protein
MTTLNQIVAIAAGTTTRTFETKRDVDHRLQRKNLLEGRHYKYDRLNEEGEELQPEHQKVQTTVEAELERVREALVQLWDVTATRETANTEASADVVVGERTLLRDVPVTLLLFLEKQLEDIHTMVARLPVLSAGYDWTYDSTQSVHVSNEYQTNRTQREPHVVVKWAPPTPEYKQPAQTEVISQDKVVGHWKKREYSGALPSDQVRAMVRRVEVLQRAVKFAREQANSIDVVDVKIGEEVLDYIFDGV